MYPIGLEHEPQIQELKAIIDQKDAIIAINAVTTTA